jgi:fucose 4-O-acetylase-like acetyltransferase
MLNFLFNKDVILKESRYPWIDYARGICIILVVYRHVYEALEIVGEGTDSFLLLRVLNAALFSFRMPLFFVVSGLFFAASFLRKGLGEYINNRVQTILYPLLVWGGIQVTLQLVFAGSVNVQREPIDYLNLLIEPRRIEQFWYLNALFSVGCLYALVHYYCKVSNKTQLIIGLVLYAAAAIVYHYGWNIGFLIDVLFYYIFFAVGDYFSKFIFAEKTVQNIGKGKSILLLLPLFVAAQAVFVYQSFSTGDDYYVHHKNSFLYLVIALVGCLFIIALSFFLERKNILRFLRVVGYHSLYIYVMHLMIAAGTRVFFVKVLGYEEVIPLMLICITLGIVIPMIAYNFAAKMGMWWLFSLKKDPLRRKKVNNGTKT